MTRYTLSSDSPRWWWPPAAAGAVAAALVAGVLLLPAAGQDASAPAPPAESSSPVPVDRDRPCFLVRAPWNASLDGPQPRCSAEQPATPPRTVLVP